VENPVARPVAGDESPLVTALFAALDLACDHSDVEIICRLSMLLDRLAAQERRRAER
jgi:hypothetical protein